MTNPLLQMKNKPKKPDLELYLEASFDFMHYENAQNVAMALATSGRYVKVRKEYSGVYSVDIYSEKLF